MDNFFTHFGLRKREAAATPTVTDNTTNQGGGSYSSNAVLVNGKSAALAIPAFYRAAEVIATTMAQLKWEYQVRSRVGGNFVMATRGPVAKRLNYLLAVRPNPLMSASKLQEQMALAVIFQGNACLYIDREGGEIRAFWFCTSATLDKISNTYNIQYNGLGGQITLNSVPAADVIHIRNTFSFDGGLTGVSTLTYAAKTLSIAATNDKLTLDNAAKGGRMKLLLQEEKKASMGVGRAAKKELEKVRNQMESDVYSKDVILLTNIANATPISMNSQEQQLLETRKFSVRDIARIMGVPPIMLMDDSNSSYKSPEFATQELLVRCISPKIKEWENEYNCKLLGEDSWGDSRYHLCELPLMRLDPAGQAALDEKHLQTGWSVNEIRAQYDLPTIDKGDLHYISTNLAELGSDKLSGGSTPTPEPEPTEKGGAQ